MMTPEQIRIEAEVLVVISGGRLSMEAAIQAVEEDAAMLHAKNCAGFCTCGDAPEQPASLWRRLLAWLLSPLP